MTDDLLDLVDESSMMIYSRYLNDLDKFYDKQPHNQLGPTEVSNTFSCKTLCAFYTALGGFEIFMGFRDRCLATKVFGGFITLSGIGLLASDLCSKYSAQRDYMSKEEI